MEIIITEEAAKKINERVAGREGYLQLKYDTDGCGWAVSGVAALWFTGELDDTEVEIETNDRPVYIEKHKMVFFDEQMKIDFSTTSNCFQLKSPQQILNGRMSLVLKETDWSIMDSLFLAWVSVVDIFFQKFIHDPLIVIRVFVKGLGVNAFLCNIEHFRALFVFE